MKRMTGPASIVWIAQSSRRPATGAISIRRTRGTVRSGEAQNARMPARVMAMRAASPDRISTRSKIQLGDRDGASRRIERSCQERELGDEAGERRQAGNDEARNR